jgi:ABC-2 type transport system ATP-binding protein
MQQKSQIINTVLHKQELLIDDEPFSGLDPVNTKLVKDLMDELRERGTTIIMSTHMMHQVEELCDRIVLINHGRNVLYGQLNKIRRAYAGHAVLVRVDGPMPEVTGVEMISQHNGAVQLNLADDMTPQDVLTQLVSSQARIEQFEIAAPGLDEIFIQAVGDKTAAEGGQ